MSQRQCAGLDCTPGTICGEDQVSVPPRVTRLVTDLVMPPSNSSWRRAPLRDHCPPVARAAVGVGQGRSEEQPGAVVRRADARSAQIGGPDGIAQRFHVSANSGEPRPSRATRNLLSKDDWRSELFNEVSPDGPKVSRIRVSAPLPRDTERLARTGPCPNRGGVGHPRKTQGVGPSPHAGEEVRLGRRDEIDLLYRARVNKPGSDSTTRLQAAKPDGGERRRIVVERRGLSHGLPPEGVGAGQCTWRRVPPGWARVRG